MLKIVEKKVRTSLPAVYRSKRTGSVVLFFRENYGVVLRGINLIGFYEVTFDRVPDYEWERVKVRIKTLPLSKGCSFPNALRSKVDGRTVLFLTFCVAFEIDLEGCDIYGLGEGWNFFECVDSGDWELVDLNFK